MSTSQTARQFTLDTIDTHILRSGAADGPRPSIRTIRLTSNVAVGYSIVVSARPLGSTAAFVPVRYESLYLNGAAASDTTDNVAITASSLIRIDDTGLEIALVNASKTSGDFTIETVAGVDI